MSLVFFTDRDLGNVFPDTLSAAGLAVERHAEHFAHDCPDEEWLGAVGACGWVAITRDTRIRYKPNERAAVERHRVALLVMIGKTPHVELAASFVRTLPRIQALLARRAPPLIAKVYRASAAELARNPHAPGSVSLWYP